MNLRQRLPAFKSKDYRTWFIGQSVSVIGTWLQNTGQAWLVLKLTNSPFQLGLVTSIQYLPSLFLPLFLGPVVDLFPKRTILIWTQSLLGVLAAILAVICFVGNVQYWQVLIIAAITGLVSVVDFPARQSFISEQVNDRSAVVNAVALNNLSFNVGRIIGPAVGGILIALVGIPWTFALNAVSFSAVVTSLFFMKAGRVPIAVRSGNFRGEIKKRYHYIAHNKVIMTLLVIGIDSLRCHDFGWPAEESVRCNIFPAFLRFRHDNIRRNEQHGNPDAGLSRDARRVMSAYNLVWIGTTPIGSLYVGGVSDTFGPAAGFWLSGAICLVFLLVMLVAVVPRTFSDLSSFVKHETG